MSSQPSRSGQRAPASSFTHLLPVPQKRWKPHFPNEETDTLYPFPPITFNLIHPRTGQATPGVPLAYIAALGENANLGNLIQNARDKAFKDAFRAYLRILWPGYDHIEFVTSIPLKTVGGRITRGQIAQFVVKAVQQYLTRLQTTAAHPSQKGWTVGMGKSQWRLENVVLVSLYLVHGNTFQAELKVDIEQ